MSSLEVKYMEQIEKKICSLKWYISYFDCRDVRRTQLEKYSFNDKINFFKLDSLLH